MFHFMVFAGYMFYTRFALKKGLKLMLDSNGLLS